MPRRTTERAAPRGTKRMVIAALVSALVTAGAISAVAIGQGGLRGFASHNNLGSNLTFAEVHYQQNGQDVVKRIDRGTIKALTSDSITITRNDGADVTVPINAATRVIAKHKRGKKAKFSHNGHTAGLGSLEVGQTVIVVRKLNEPAKFIFAKRSHPTPQGLGEGHRKDGDDDGDPKGFVYKKRHSTD